MKKPPRTNVLRGCKSYRIVLRRIINVWVTENGGNMGILPKFVADALQTVED